MVTIGDSWASFAIPVKWRVSSSEGFDPAPASYGLTMMIKRENEIVSHTLRYIKPLSDARTRHGKGRVSARRGWAGEKRDFFSILLCFAGRREGLVDFPDETPLNFRDFLCAHAEDAPTLS